MWLLDPCRRDLAYESWQDLGVAAEFPPFATLTLEVGASTVILNSPVGVAATFEADDTRLRWLNLAVVAGTGGVVGTDTVVVELFEVR